MDERQYKQLARHKDEQLHRANAEIQKLQMELSMQSSESVCLHDSLEQVRHMSHDYMLTCLHVYMYRVYACMIASNSSDVHSCSSIVDLIIHS